MSHYICLVTPHLRLHSCFEYISHVHPFLKLSSAPPTNILDFAPIFDSSSTSSQQRKSSSTSSQRLGSLAALQQTLYHTVDQSTQQLTWRPKDAMILVASPTKAPWSPTTMTTKTRWRLIPRRKAQNAIGMLYLHSNILLINWDL